VGGLAARQKDVDTRAVDVNGTRNVGPIRSRSLNPHAPTTTTQRDQSPPTGAVAIVGRDQRTLAVSEITPPA
jgi:hypothetical protein